MKRLSNWHIFIVFLALIIGSQIIEDELISELFTAGIFIFIISYFLLTAEELRENANKKTNWFYVFNCIFMLLVYSLSLAGIKIDEGIIVLPILGYFAFSYIYVTDELAILLRNSEGKETGNFKQKKEFLLFFLWPVGIWFLQPRLRKVLE
jgi:hypothetical protein